MCSPLRVSLRTALAMEISFLAFVGEADLPLGILEQKWMKAVDNVLKKLIA